MWVLDRIDRVSDIAYAYGMGRPPLNMKPTLVRFSSNVIDRIDALVGQKHRAKFIREAVDAELERREKELDRDDYPNRDSDQK
ncbi:hypothetical protein [Xanthobacter oligotrophicus]|uniref:hypothetical protein n=1 Tax=Xanthobacter oligotrophicus TaxID=2607286 RepID=UPI001E50F35D|nr:hypothetical protein [Xanthobacter oligotrophicus]MCG5237113.1 hypothetical protein [Xanthobacter oligotrophicus]